MKFTTVLLALPALVLAQTKVQPLAPRASPDPAICQGIAGVTYAPYCERCGPSCVYDFTKPGTYEACLEDTFFVVDWFNRRCQQNGGQNCVGQAVDTVCGGV